MTEATLERLADLESIRDLARRYAHHIWQGQLPQAIELFALNGKMDFGEEGVIQGRDRLLEVYKEKIAGTQMLHPFIHNHVIDFFPEGIAHGAEAQGVCYLDLRTVKEGQSLMGAGFYSDLYVREQGQWKFESRKLTLCYLVPPTQGWV